MTRLHARVGTIRWYALALAGAICGGVLGMMLLLSFGEAWIWLMY